MCVAIPARIVSITTGLMPMAQVEINGETQQCCLAYHPEAEVGDHVLVQRGFAIELLDAEAAASSLAAFQALGVLPGDAHA